MNFAQYIFASKWKRRKRRRNILGFVHLALFHIVFGSEFCRIPFCVKAKTSQECSRVRAFCIIFDSFCDANFAQVFFVSKWKRRKRRRNIVGFVHFTLFLIVFGSEFCRIPFCVKVKTSKEYSKVYAFCIIFDYFCTTTSTRLSMYLPAAYARHARARTHARTHARTRTHA